MNSHAWGLQIASGPMLQCRAVALDSRVCSELMTTCCTKESEHLVPICTGDGTYMLRTSRISLFTPGLLVKACM